MLSVHVTAAKVLGLPYSVSLPHNCKQRGNCLGWRAGRAACGGYGAGAGYAGLVRAAALDARHGLQAL